MDKEYVEGFDSFEDFCQTINWGGGVEFDFSKHSYSIFQSNQGTHVLKQYDYESEKVYKSVKDIGDYTIEGKMLKDIVTNIKVFFRSM